MPFPQFCSLSISRSIPFTLLQLTELSSLFLNVVTYRNSVPVLFLSIPFIEFYSPLLEFQSQSTELSIFFSFVVLPIWIAWTISSNSGEASAENSAVEASAENSAVEASAPNSSGEAPGATSTQVEAPTSTSSPAVRKKVHFLFLY